MKLKSGLIIGLATLIAAGAVLGGSLLISAADDASHAVVWQHTEADNATDTRIQTIPVGTNLVPVCYSVSPSYPVNGNTKWFVVKVRDQLGYVSGADAGLAVGTTRRC